MFTGQFLKKRLSWSSFQTETNEMHCTKIFFLFFYLSGKWYSRLHRSLAIVLAMYQKYLSGDNWSGDTQQFMAFFEKRWPVHDWVVVHHVHIMLWCGPQKVSQLLDNVQLWYQSTVFQHFAYILNFQFRDKLQMQLLCSFWIILHELC